MSAFPWKGVAWDVDGTLIDSEPLHHAALVDVAGRYGLDLSGLDPAAFVGIHVRDVYARLQAGLPGDLGAARFEAAIEDAYALGAGGLAPLAGAEQAIRALAAAGTRQVCVSNSSRRVVAANLARLDVADALSGMVCLDDVMHGKPAPEPYLRGAALLRLDPSEMLAVEDSLAGATAALAAGMHVAVLGTPPAALGTDPRILPVSRLADIPYLRPVSGGSGQGGPLAAAGACGI